MKVCRCWSNIGRPHLSETIIVRSKADVSRFIKLFEEFLEADSENAQRNGDDSQRSSASIHQADLLLDRSPTTDLVSEDAIPLLPYLPNLKIVVIHTYRDSPFICDALMNSCESSLEYFDWSGPDQVSFVTGTGRLFSSDSVKYKDGLQKTFPLSSNTHNCITMAFPFSIQNRRKSYTMVISHAESDSGEHCVL
jgi:hypothetical protein